jgi:hypothetical protein
MDTSMSPSHGIPPLVAEAVQDISWDELKLMVDGENIQ